MWDFCVYFLYEKWLLKSVNSTTENVVHAWCEFPLLGLLLPSCQLEEWGIIEKYLGFDV